MAIQAKNLHSTKVTAPLALLVAAMPLLTYGCAAEPSGASGAPGAVLVSDGYGSGAGFKGYWYTYKDDGGSSIKPECGARSAPCFMGAARICVSGEGSQVQMGMFSTYWGAGVGWNLNQATSPPNPVLAIGLKGKSTIAVTLDMKTTSPLRMKLKVAGDTTDYCANLSPGLNTIPLSGITSECWMSGGDPIAADAMVEALQFQIPTTDGSSTPFDFCITSLSIK